MLALLSPVHVGTGGDGDDTRRDRRATLLLVDSSPLPAVPRTGPVEAEHGRLKDAFHACLSWVEIRRCAARVRRATAFARSAFARMVALSALPGVPTGPGRFGVRQDSEPFSSFWVDIFD